MPARGLWVGSEYVRLATVSDAKQLYLRQCDRGNSQNTLLLLYAPWCPHCRDMEDELERLAEGLSHVPNVRIMAVNGDSTEGRVFSREVLGVAYYPSIVSFPAHSRTFFKYKGRARDAEALLRFFNMTCCAREDTMWSLRPAGTRAGVALPGAGQSEVVAELDTSMGRMSSLLVRALGTRMVLTLGLAKAPGAAAASSQVVAAAPVTVPTPPVPASAAPAVVAAAAVVPAAAVASPVIPALQADPVSIAASSEPTSRSATQAEAAATVAQAGNVTPRELTAEERLKLTRLTDDELIALVNSDPDLDKVLSRLLGDQ
ncbi:EYE2 protein [Gonium pectorale]|uniref:EYE2 protein n=1 Tax=Gonium pectorale TaxID=33097 RepID=A0A150H296_GONPE|nr:EYE2 protein [Gonium pectorale]|eukprot:KXZ55958.1 EYE2 protein [Gonium pectorale]